ncbi:MAG: M24 family metallopeptidase [Sphingobacteriia bacterium]|nr:MAG: M24 family metallopeptidase [Sphingobacteriia bacterium]
MKYYFKWVAVFFLVWGFFAEASAQPLSGRVLGLRDQAKVINEVLQERLDSLLPQLMAQNGIDCWVVMGREYNEDPVLKTMLPAEWLNARRRTILVFYQPPQGKPLEKLAIARYDVGTAIKAAWDMKAQPDQWDALLDLLQKRQPKKIALNLSESFAHADGLSATEQKAFVSRLPKAMADKIVSAEPLAVAWLATRSAKEMALYPQLIRATHEIIAEGFSEKVITPGITTTEDLVWWFRQKIRDLGYDTWFHPSVAIQRNDPENFEHLRSFSARPNNNTILPGDLLHVDIGISYLRLQTDIQQHAYVLLPGEKTVPAALQKAFAAAQQVQNILTAEIATGKSGNEVLTAALQKAKAAGLEPSIYSHPIGYHGHAAGPAIGMWDNQVAVPKTGEAKFFPFTAFSIELNAASPVPEWKKTIRIMLEEDAFFDGKSVRYIGGRQTSILTIPRALNGVE